LSGAAASSPPGFLADACALIVFHAEGGAGMSAAGLAAMRGGDVAVSALTLWEITRKVAQGKLPPVPIGADGSSALGCSSRATACCH
jgi:hypothetical protein